MAQSKVGVIVEISEKVHANMREYAQELYEKHGVMVEDVTFDWSMTMSGEARVMDVCVRTRTK